MSDFKPLDKVTWTHQSRRGRAVSLTLKTGSIVAIDGDVATVKTTSGRYTYGVPLTALRRVGERSTLTEFCDIVFAANRETKP